VGQRERRKRRDGESRATMERGYARGRQRDETIRSALAPLAPGQRTNALTVACVVAVLLAISVVVGAATGSDLAQRGGSWVGAILIAAVLLLAAWGMWRTRYWAVLGFEAFLAFQIIVSSLALVVASSWWAVLICLAIVGFSGWLAWKLIRVMARIQAHERGDTAPVS
jgi:cation transport ATPase